MNLSQSVYLSGIGSSVPKKILTNEDLSKMVDTSDHWIQTRSGISTRRIASPSQSTSDMGVEAGRQAIKDAGLEPKDIDIIIVATITPDTPFPATACWIQKKLELGTIPAFDIGAACSGFIYLLDIGKHLLRSGNYSNALLIGAEKMSSIVDWEDRTTCVLFGDGAGAAVLSKSNQSNTGILDTLLGSDGNNAELLYQPVGGSNTPLTQDNFAQKKHFLQMNGREVFKHAVKVMEKATLSILERNQIQPQDLKYIIPHQANLRIIENLAHRLNMPLNRFYNNLDNYGNTSAASIPLALNECYREKNLKTGDLILLVAFGGGLTWAASIIKWNKEL